MKDAIPIRLHCVCPRRSCSRVSGHSSATPPTSPYPLPPSPSDLGLMPNLSFLTPKELIRTPFPPFHDRINPIQNP